MKAWGWILAFSIPLSSLGASTIGPQKSGLAEKLTGIRTEVIKLEQDLIDSLKTQKQAKSNIQRIQALLKLQQKEQQIGKRRLAELEKTITELESRRAIIRERIDAQNRVLRQALLDLGRSLREVPQVSDHKAKELVEGPRRKVLANLVGMGLKEVEALKVDLADADQLESRIEEEKQQLAYLFQEVKEHESLLEVNRQLQSDLIEQKHAERIAQLENYRRLKGAESQVEQLITQFNARIELQEAVRTERNANRAHVDNLAKIEQMNTSAFAKLKGKLPLPVAGKIISDFGRSFDSKAKLYIFKKGIDIETAKNQSVVAVYDGKVAFSGELPNYGRLTIIDHGNHFYTLLGHLGALSKKAGDVVRRGDQIGSTDESGTPVYFEIRARNIAVNPLQWISN